MRLDAKEIYAEIKANRERLNGCKVHRFELGPPPYEFGKKLTCLNCGGVMDAIGAFNYAAGYEAAGGNPNHVMGEGYK